MRRIIHVGIDTHRIDLAKLQAISDDLAAIGIDFEHTGRIDYDDNDPEIEKKNREIFDKHLPC